MQKSIICFSLTLIFVLTIFTVSSADTTSTRIIVKGIVHSEIAVTGPNVVEVLEIDLKNPYLRLETSRGNLLATTSAQASANDSAGHRVIGAVNGDYFGTNGWPQENAILNGKPLMATAGAGSRTHLAVTDQGKPFIDKFAFSSCLVAKNGNVLSIDEVNSWRMSGTTGLFDSFYGATTGTDASGIECSLMPLFSTWRANDTLLFVVASVQSGGNKAIPAAGIVISVGSGTPSDFITANVAAGDTVKICIGFTPKTVKNIVQLIGGAGRLVKNGANVANSAAGSEGLTSSFYNVRNSRTFAGFNADTSKFYFCTVDKVGTTSLGMTFDEMAKFLLTINVSEAYNLDGGGSTTMVVQGSVVNHLPTSERAVATTLQVISSAKTGTVEILNILEDRIEMRKDTTYKFHAECKDFYLTALSLPTGLKWGVDSTIGSIDTNGIFTPKNVADSGWVRVSYGTVSDSARVVVLGPFTNVPLLLRNIPDVFQLSQNFPNPFNPSTKIGYALSTRSRAILSVYNLLGQKISELVNDVKDAGYYEVSFDATEIASGIYFYRLESGGFMETKKLMVVK